MALASGMSGGRRGGIRSGRRSRVSSSIKKARGAIGSARKVASRGGLTGTRKSGGMGRGRKR